jgi:hypothetical protein
MVGAIRGAVFRCSHTGIVGALLRPRLFLLHRSTGKIRWALVFCGAY